MLQAIANMVAKQVYERRRAVQGKSVFSNCLTSDPNSIFFLQDWRLTYNLFKSQLQRHLDAGNQWIAHFDLAAFYETISHRALQSIVAPAGGGGEVWELIRQWLCVWTSSVGGIPVDHGIPQGPIIEFLAEVFLLPLDEAMKNGYRVRMRYVDDIRVLAKTEAAARRAAMTLELACRRLSLIPQSSKFSVSPRASNIVEALGAFQHCRSTALRGLRSGHRPRRQRNLLKQTKGRQQVIDETGSWYCQTNCKGLACQRVVDTAPSRAHRCFCGFLAELLPFSQDHAAHHGHAARGRPIRLCSRRTVADSRADGPPPENFQNLLDAAKVQAARQHLSFSMRRGLVAYFMSAVTLVFTENTTR